MKTLVFLNRCYWPDSEATGQLLTDLSRRLTDRFDVHVVCGAPNSPSTEDYVRVGVQNVGGVTVHRLKHARLPKSIPAGRIVNLLSFTRAAKRYLRKTNLPADIVVSETDPFLLPVVGVDHARRVGGRSVAYLQDVYPDVAIAVGKAKPGSLTTRITSRLRAAYRRCDRVIVLGSCMRDRLIGPNWQLDPDTIRIIPNWADTRSIRPIDGDQNELRKHLGLQNRFVLMHSGNMGLTQNLDQIIAAMAHRRTPDDATLVLVGDGASRRSLARIAHETFPGQVAVYVRSENGQMLTHFSHPVDPAGPPPRVVFLPYQPREQLADSLSAADVHLISMAASITGCLCPSKLYGVMAAGRPVLAIAPEPTDLARTVESNRIGWVVPPGDTAALAATIQTARDDATDRLSRGQTARRLAVSEYDFEVVAERFADCLEQLA